MTVTRIGVYISVLCERRGKEKWMGKEKKIMGHKKTRQERRREEIVLNVHFQCLSFLRQSCLQESLSVVYVRASDLNNGNANECLVV